MPLDFVCIGTQKSATTWLYDMLKQHPQVKFGVNKELYFFCDKQSFYVREPLNNFQKGKAWYEQQLQSEKNKLSGDMTVDYIWDPVCAKRIKKMYPKAKILAILRNPIERAQSQYLYASQVLYLAKNFTQAIRKYPEFIERGLYYEQLNRYYKLFNKKQIKVILHDDIRKNPEKVLREVEAFLGIKTFIPKNLKSSSNKTVYPKYKIFTRIMGSAQKIKETKLGVWLWNNKPFVRFKNTTIKVIQKINLQEAKKPRIPEQTTTYLKKYYQKDLKQLEKLINRKVMHWIGK